MNNRLKCALIGCGTVSANHFYALDKLKEKVEVVALCDLSEEKCNDANRKYGFGARVYTDYLKMYDECKLDAVHIATPHYLHAPMTIEALKRGIYVFSEKPMCINEEQMEEMLKAERESTASAAVCFQNRFCPAILKAKEIVKEDGGAVTGYGALFWERDEKYYTESGWRGRYETEGGGVMINQAIHTLDLLCEFLGKPVTVRATTNNRHLAGIIEVEDTCEGIIGFDSGKRANFYATTSFIGAASTTLFIVTKNHTVEMRGYDLFVDGEYVNTDDHKNFVGKACYGNGHLPLIERFYDAILTGNEMPVTLESAKHAVKLLLAAYKSNDETVNV